jgi:uncharacterized protein
MNRPTPPPTIQAQPLLVLDTNVVLDWLVFRDRGCDALGETLTRGLAQWIATQAMRDELEHVLTRGSLDAWAPDGAALGVTIWAWWDKWAQLVDTPPQPQSQQQPPLELPRCTDPDDQKFIDLGLHIGASALLSRDRAVLRCARSARALGLEIMTPHAWASRNQEKGRP